MRILIRPARDLEFSSELLKEWGAKWVFWQGHKALSLPYEKWDTYGGYHRKYSCFNFIYMIGPIPQFGITKDFEFLVNTDKSHDVHYFEQPNPTVQYYLDDSNADVVVITYKTNGFRIENIQDINLSFPGYVSNRGLIITGENRTYLDALFALYYRDWFGWVALKRSDTDAVIVYVAEDEYGERPDNKKEGDIVEIPPQTIDITSEE